jgi:hypothetical protein
LDEGNICKSGDTVIIERIEGARETAESLSLKEMAVKEFWKPGQFSSQVSHILSFFTYFQDMRNEGSTVIDSKFLESL